VRAEQPAAPVPVEKDGIRAPAERFTLLSRRGPSSNNPELFSVLSTKRARMTRRSSQFTLPLGPEIALRAEFTASCSFS
jgi:hypothetical protein